MITESYTTVNVFSQKLLQQLEPSNLLFRIDPFYHIGLMFTLPHDPTHLAYILVFIVKSIVCLALPYWSLRGGNY